jgi:glycerol-3-phosphate dehydrogenase
LSGDGALVRDMLTGTTHSIKARSVVNATGVWAGGLVPGVSLRPSRGTHLVLAKDTLPIRDAVLAPVPHEHNRFVFALPQSDGRVYVGITDEPVDGPLPEIPEPTPGEIGFLLDVIGAAFERPITRADVAGAYAGLRPLLDAHGRTSDLSRRHAVLTSPEGVVTVVGGKLTTYRRMAEDAVDAAVKRRGLEAGPCRTGNLPVVGAATIRLCCASEKGTNLDRRIVSRFGDEAGEVVAHAVELTGLSEAEVLEPIAAGVTRAELVWGVTHEVALDVDDLLDRRTRVGLVDAERRLVEPAARDALSLSARGR